jgi:hypothetical protein
VDDNLKLHFQEIYGFFFLSFAGGAPVAPVSQSMNLTSHAEMSGKLQNFLKLYTLDKILSAQHKWYLNLLVDRQILIEMTML